MSIVKGKICLLIWVYLIYLVSEFPKHAKLTKTITFTFYPIHIFFNECHRFMFVLNMIVLISCYYTMRIETEHIIYLHLVVLYNYIDAFDNYCSAYLSD